MVSIFYNQPGSTYDDDRFTWDGEIYVAPPDPQPSLDTDIVRSSIFWGGGSTASRLEDEKRRRRVFTSLAVEAKVMSINGYDLNFSITGQPDVIRYAGEDDDTEVSVHRLKLETTPTNYEVESFTLQTHPLEPSVAFGGMEGEMFEEPEGELYQDEYEDSDAVLEVSGGLFPEANLLVEATLFTGSLAPMVLSCQPVTKSDDSPIITLEEAAIKHE